MEFFKKFGKPNPEAAEEVIKAKKAEIQAQGERIKKTIAEDSKRRIEAAQENHDQVISALDQDIANKRQDMISEIDRFRVEQVFRDLEWKLQSTLMSVLDAENSGDFKKLLADLKQTTTTKVATVRESLSLASLQELEAWAVDAAAGKSQAEEKIKIAIQNFQNSLEEQNITLY